MMRKWWNERRGDVIGGLNAAVIALPLAIAFGMESGLGASAGLVGAIVMGVVASLFGGTTSLISGPTAAMTVASSLIIAREFEQSPDQGTALTTIFIIFLIAGLLQVIFGLLRLGQYIRFAPYPLVAGFMNGIGLMMVIFQLLPLVGHHPSIHFEEIVVSVSGVHDEINVQALALGLLTIAVIYIFPRFSKKIPAILVALVASTTVAVVAGLNVPTLADVPDEWIKWRWSHLVDYQLTAWSDVVIPAFTLATLGSIDTLLTCMVTDMTTGASHKSNKELLGQGLGNMASAVAGGLPGAGAVVRTVVNARAGGRTFLSVVIQSAVLLLAMLELGFLQFIPQSVLAAILISVGINIIDYKGLRQIFRVSVTDGVVLLLVMITTIVFGLPYAFIGGIVLSSLLFVKKMAEQTMRKTEPLVLLPEGESPGSEFVLSREIYVQQLQGPLFFGFSVHFREAMQALPDARAILFRMDQVPFADHSGLVALQEILKQLNKKGIVVAVSGLQPAVREQLGKAGIIPEILGPDRLFGSFVQAAIWLEKHLELNPSEKLRKSGLRDLKLDSLRERRN